MKNKLSVIALAATLVACSQPSQENHSLASAPEAAKETLTDQNAQTLNSAIFTQENTAQLADKQLIINGELHFKTKSTLDTLTAVETSALAHGGYIKESSLSSSTMDSRTYNMGDGQIKEMTLSNHHATVIVRVPKEKLADFLKEISPLMQQLTTRTLTAQDVTLDIYKSRLQSQIEQDKQKALNDLESSPKDTLNDKTTVASESALARHEALFYELEQKALMDKVALSTLSLQFYDNPVLHESIRPDLDKALSHELSRNFGHEFLSSLHTGWYYLLSMLLWLTQLWGLWLMIAAALWGFGRYRKYKKRHNKTNDTPSTNTQDTINSDDTPST